jgi:hypothetical protein
VLLIEEEFKDLPLKDRAYIASMARCAARERPVQAQVGWWAEWVAWACGVGLCGAMGGVC